MEQKEQIKVNEAYFRLAKRELKQENVDLLVKGKDDEKIDSIRAHYFRKHNAQLENIGEAHYPDRLKGNSLEDHVDLFANIQQKFYETGANLLVVDFIPKNDNTELYVFTEVYDTRNL